MIGAPTQARHIKQRGPLRLLATIMLTLGLLVAPNLPARADAAPFTYCYSANNQNCVSQWGYTGQSTWGYPLDAYGNNCTNYAAFRLNQNGYLNPGNLGDASSWATNARNKGLTVTSGASNRIPNVGDVAQWNYGHVAYVEWVSADRTQFAISETGYGPWNGIASMSGRGIFGGGGRHNESAWPDNFIHFNGGNGGGGGGTGEGSFISHGGHVYRIAGGAPMYVSTWNVFGGAQPTTAVSDGQFNALRTHPADNTFVNGATSGRVYRFAGGAPLYVSTWNSYGGSQPSISVDDYAIDHPDGSSPLNHVRRYPADGTFISNTADGRVYRVAGGAPLYVSSWSNIGGAQPVTSIDPWEFTNYQRLRPRPTDMFLRGLPSKRIFRVTYDGHPYYVDSWTPYGGTQPFLDVDDWAIDNCDHLECSPFGHLDAVTSSSGKVTVTGWAIDPNARTTPTGIHVYVGGPAGDPNAQGFNVGTAEASRGDVAKEFPGTGSSHGFTKTVTTSKRGAQPVYVYAINVTGTKGGNAEVGHKTVTVATPLGQFTATPTPKISGTVKVGHTLTGVPGTWKPTPTSFVYGWFRNETPIPGATGLKYTLTGTDKGARIQFSVGGRITGYQPISMASSNTKAVAAGTLHTVTPKITGTRRVGSTLTAKPGTWGPAGVSLGYQWYRNGKKVTGATAATYHLAKADKGKKLKVKVTGRMTGWTTASRTSRYTGKIR